MATLLPPPSKRAKRSESAYEATDLSTVTGNILCQFKAADSGQIIGTTVRIPAKTTAKELEVLLNQLLNNVNAPSVVILTDESLTILFPISFLLSLTMLRWTSVRTSSQIFFSQGINHLRTLLL